MLTISTTTVGIVMYRCGLCPACIGKRLIIWRQQAISRLSHTKPIYLVLLVLAIVAFFAYMWTMYPQIFYFARYRVWRRSHTPVVKASARLRRNVTYSDVCSVECAPDVDAMMTSSYDVPYEALSSAGESFTVITTTNHNDDVIKTFLKHYSKMRRVRKIILFWNKPGVKPPDYEKQLKLEVALVIKVVNSTSLLARFSALKDIRTEGVMVLDDDIILNREELYLAFNLWKAKPWGIIGFYGGVHSLSGRTSYTHSGVPYNYYSMIQSGAFLLHKEYLRMYVQRYSRGGARVECEDFAMNFLVSSHCKCSAAYLVIHKSWYIRVTERLEVLSTKWQYRTENNVCLNYMTNIFGSMPLKSKSCFW